MNPLTGVIGEAGRIYRAHTAHLLAIAFVFYAVTAVVVGLLDLIGIVGLFIGWVFQLFSGFLLQATLIKAVQDVRDGRADLSLGETVSAAWPYLLPVAVAAILAGIAITIGFVLLIVPGLILITIWAVIMPVIVLERSDAMASFRRSQQLVRGNGWPVFGTLVVLWIIQIVVNILLDVLLSALPGAVGTGLSTVVAGTLVAPFIALTVTLIYYRLSGQDAPPYGPGGQVGSGAGSWPAGWPGGPGGPGDAGVQGGSGGAGWPAGSGPV